MLKTVLFCNAGARNNRMLSYQVLHHEELLQNMRLSNKSQFYHVLHYEALLYL